MHKVKANVQMKGLVAGVVDDFGNEDAALCFGPAEDFANEAEGVGLDAHAHVFALVAADFFHGGVFGPGADGDLLSVSDAPEYISWEETVWYSWGISYLDNLLAHVHKPRVFHPPLNRVSHSYVLLEPRRRIIAQLLPPRQILGIRQRPVVALGQRNRLLELGPPARHQMRIRLLDQAVPVGNRPAHGAAVHEIKSLGRRIHPLGLGIVDVELCIRRHPRGLDGREVGAQDIAARVFVGEVNGPDSGAGANVEDALELRGDGRVVQLAAQDQQEDVVQQVQAVLLLLVVGEQVRAPAVAGVAPPIAVFVVQDRGCEGRGCARVGVEGAVRVGGAAGVGLDVQHRLQVAVGARGIGMRVRLREVVVRQLRRVRGWSGRRGRCRPALGVCGEARGCHVVGALQQIDSQPNTTDERFTVAVGDGLRRLTTATAAARRTRGLLIRRPNMCPCSAPFPEAWQRIHARQSMT
jgi:hypothetical protein